MKTTLQTTVPQTIFLLRPPTHSTDTTHTTQETHILHVPDRDPSKQHLTTTPSLHQNHLRTPILHPPLLSSSATFLSTPASASASLYLNSIRTRIRTIQVADLLPLPNLSITRASSHPLFLQASTPHQKLSSHSCASPHPPPLTLNRLHSAPPFPPTTP